MTRCPTIQERARNGATISALPGTIPVVRAVCVSLVILSCQSFGWTQNQNSETEQELKQEQSRAQLQEQRREDNLAASDRAASDRRAKDLEQKTTNLSREFQLLKAQFESANNRAGVSLQADLAEAREAIVTMFQRRNLQTEIRIEQLARHMVAAWKELESTDSVQPSPVFTDDHGLQKQWTRWYEEIRDRDRQQIADLRARMKVLAKQNPDPTDGWDEASRARGMAIHQQFETVAEKLQAILGNSLAEFQDETERLYRNAEIVSGSAGAKLISLGDLLSQQRNTIDEELWVTDREAVARIQESLAEALRKEEVLSATKAPSDIQFLSNIRSDVDSLTHELCDRAERWVSRSRGLRVSLDQQLQSLDDRVSSADAEVAESLRDLRIERRLKFRDAEQKLTDAQTSHAKALSAAIDRMKTQLVGATPEARDRLFETIEQYQNRLERVRGELLLRKSLGRDNPAF